MKALKSACAVVFAAGLSCAAHAATYNVNGVMTGVDVDIPLDPNDYAYVVTFNPSNPAFSGQWNIDLNTFALSGVADFQSYQANTNMTLFGMEGSTSLTRPHDVQTIDGSGATYSYNALTRTLTMTQPTITLVGVSADCTATGIMACGPDDYIPDTLNDITILLTFDESFQSFTGSSTITRYFKNLETGELDGSADHTHWTFSGAAVPVPAAAWLFGSGVLGLAGIARRRGRK